MQLNREKRSKLQDKRSKAIDELKAKRSAGKCYIIVWVFYVGGRPLESSCPCVCVNNIMSNRCAYVMCRQDAQGRDWKTAI